MGDFLLVQRLEGTVPPTPNVELPTSNSQVRKTTGHLGFAVAGFAFGFGSWNLGFPPKGTSPLQRFEAIFGGGDQFVGQAVEFALDLAGALGPFMGILRKALMDQLTQRF